jgi:hypothetical protein
MIFDLLWSRTWWRYRPSSPTDFPMPYYVHAFNLFEGTAWVVFGVLVLARFLRWRRSAIEVGYAVAFFCFGLTDFVEAYALSSWLIWVKLANLIVLAWLRAIVIRRYYPTSRLY